MTDWLSWHGDYDDPRSELSARLGVVRGLIDGVVAGHDARPLRILSLCAGDGRDLLPVLDRRKRAGSFRVRLIELDPELADRARRFAAEHALAGVEVACADAARATNYSGAVPADLVVACGILGNVSNGDARRLIAAMPSLCAERGFVVWTRHRRRPDLTPVIRRWFVEAGFEERAFESPGVDRFSVGLHQLVGARSVLAAGDEPLFTFVR